MLGLLAGGLDNAAVARRLGVSSKTVRNHVSNLITKLQVSDRSGAILRARDAGLRRDLRAKGEAACGCPMGHPIRPSGHCPHCRWSAIVGPTHPRECDHVGSLATDVAQRAECQCGTPARRQHPLLRLETGTAQMLLGLQRSVGNAGVVKLMARRGGVGSRTAPRPRSAGKAQSEPVVQRAGPLVVTAVTAPAELGVGRRVTARATVTGTGSAGLTWALSGAPTGVSIIPRGRQAEIRSAPSVPGAPVGGASFTVSCAVGSGTPIVSSPVLLVEVTGAAFTPVPAFGGPSSRPSAPRSLR